MKESKLTHGQLFGGIFGFGLAAQWAGIENVWYNENNKHCCDIVRARIKDGSITDNVKIYEQDIKEIGKHNLQYADIISGGVPCQPASLAGKRKGEKDDRWLWPEAIRIIGDLKPAYVIFENPPGILSLDDGKAFDRILSSLENKGYEIEIFNIPACGVGAWHRRERIWIIAHSNSIRECPGYRKIQGANEEISKWHNDAKLNNPDKFNTANPHNPRKRTPRSGTEQYREKMEQDRNNAQPELSGHVEDASDIKGKRIQGFGTSGEQKSQTHVKKTLSLRSSERERSSYWKAEPRVDRMVHGLPNRVDRLIGIGNAIVPQVAYEFFNAINQITPDSSLSSR